MPEGSSLGPLLNLLYVDDIACVSSKLLLILFADDTNALISGKNIDEIIQNINTELEKISTWLAANKLSLNVKKTHFMIFKPKNKKIIMPHESICIGNEEINQVESTKFLGVYIDSKLNWQQHIKCVKNKISKGAGIIYKVKPLLNESTLLTLYYSFVYPYLYYGIIAWGTTYESYLKSVKVAQKRVIRVIASAGRNDHTEPLFKKYKLLNVYKLYVYNCAFFMFKAFHGKLPQSMMTLF